MRSSPPRRAAVAALFGVIVGLAGAGLAVALLDVPDAAPADGSSTAAPTASTATPSAPAASTPATASPTPSASASPQGGTPLSDLAALVPERVEGFSQLTNQPAPQLLDETGAQDARRVRYAKDGGDEVDHVVALFSDTRAAAQSFRRRRAQLLDRRGARVIDNIALEDSRGIRRGRLLQVRTRSGDVAVVWRNRNLVGVLGPGRPKLQRRLYDAWPY